MPVSRILTSCPAHPPVRSRSSIHARQLNGAPATSRCGRCVGWEINAPMGSRLLVLNHIPPAIRPVYDYIWDADVVELQDIALARLGRHWRSFRGS